LNLNIKNMVDNFGAIYVENMNANFQPYSFNGMGGEWGDRFTRDVTPDPYAKFLNTPLRFPFLALERIIHAKSYKTQKR